MSSFIINVKLHENAIHKGSHAHYRTEAVLENFQMSNSFTYIDYKPHPFPSQAFSFQPLHTRYTPFYLSTSHTLCPLNLIEGWLNIWLHKGVIDYIEELLIT